MNSRLLVFVALMGIGAGACSEGNDLRIKVMTDLRVPDELDGLRIVIEMPEKTLFDRTYQLHSQDDVPATLGIDSETPGTFTVEITVFGLKGETVVAEGKATAVLGNGETVEIFLYRSKPAGGDGGFDGSQDAGRDSGGHDAGGASDGSEVFDLSDVAVPADTETDVGVDTGATDVAIGDAGVDGGGGIDAATEDSGTDAGVLDAAAPDSEPDAGEDAGVEDDGQEDAGFDAGCVAETWISFCGRYARTCGLHTGADNCGNQRTEDCGTCAGCTSVCNQGLCEPVSHASFACDSDDVWWLDSCAQKQEIKDDCTVGQVCTGQACCTPEDDSTFCARLQKNCGIVVDGDNCGVKRSLASCGTCTPLASCSRMGQPGVCGNPISYVWSKHFAANIGDGGRHAVVDSSGNVYFAGAFSYGVDFGGGVIEADGVADLVVAKYDSAGANVWTKHFGAGGSAGATAIALDSTGNPLVAGMFSGTVSLGGPALTANGNYEMFVAKYDTAGNHVWSRRIQTGDDSYLVSVAADANGNVFATGLFVDSIDLGGGSLSSNGGRDIFLAMFDSAGNHVWSKRFGGTGTDQGMSVAAANGGGVVVTGYFDGTVDFGGGALTGGAFLARFDVLGGHAWSKAFGSPRTAEGYSVSIGRDDQIVLAGGFQGSIDLGGGSLGAGNGGGFLARFSSNGGHEWSQMLGTVGRSPHANMVTIDEEGNTMVTGQAGDIDLGTGTLSSAGRADFFLAEYDAAGNNVAAVLIGGPGDEYGFTVAAGGGGQAVVAGYFQGTVDFGGGPLTGSASLEVFLAKFETTGNHIFSRRVGSLDDDHGNSVAVDADGNAIIAGGFRGSAGFGGGGIQSRGDYDIYLAKYDSAGVHRWSVGMGDDALDEGANIVADGDGNTLLTGVFQGVVDFGGATHTSINGRDIFVAKYDPDGGHVWSRRLGGASGNEGYGVTADSAGSVVVTGRFVRMADFGAGEVMDTGNSGGFLAKYDGLGTHKWSKVFDGTGRAYPSSVAVDRESNELVVGYFTGTVNVGGDDLSALAGNTFLAKFDGLGTHLWSKQFSVGSINSGGSIATDSRGCAVVIGHFSGSMNLGGTDLTSAGGHDVFVLKLDPSGNHLWSKRFGGTLEDWGFSVTVGPSGNVLIAGFFEGQADFDGTVLSSAGDSDVFVLKFDPDGNRIWAKRFGGASSDMGTSIATDPSGNVILTGVFSSTIDFGGGVLTSAGGADVFLVKMRP